MLEKFRAFLVVIGEGSLHRAAARLRLSQSALSRQMQALEYELGGPLLERTSAGVRPTSGGKVLAEKAGALLAGYEALMGEVRQSLRGEGEALPIGTIGSVVSEHLGLALDELHLSHPATKLKLVDLSPGEQVAALRRGDIDLAVMDQGGDLLARDFSTRKIAALSVVAVLPRDHPLASRKEVRLAELKDETFTVARDSHLPGYNRRLNQLCRKFGKFRPKCTGEVGSLAEALALVANTGAVALIPAFAGHNATSCVVTIPLPEVTWDLLIVWQRGRAAGALRALLDSLSTPAKQDTVSS